MDISDYCQGDIAFTAWLTEVDDILNDQLFMGVLDIADQCWRDMFDDDETAEDCAGRILANPYDYI